ncbi:MAG: 30S ribosomal protein S12 methylthiotransferase RimO [Desulfobacteraceae bacterium]|nr:30S ribosomal protein S12 methylthiotransferase RimO [Desulfobacteraceae bacterium]
MKSACLVSLGCAKNLVDSEVMVRQLVDRGYRMSGENSESGLIVVNTCGFLESAVQEAIEAVLSAALHKVSGKCRTLVVAGCMVQRYGKKLLQELPEVDIFLGTSHYHRIAEAIDSHLAGNPRKLWIERPRRIAGTEIGRVRSTASHTAYVKIAEGCGNACSFCIIPNLRGPLRSRDRLDIVSEVRQLAAEGVREVNLIAQDTTAYGLDRGGDGGLPGLLEDLERVDGISWIRILYSYPDRIDERLLRTISQSEKIVPYLDIPIQHAVPSILKAMGRPAEDPQRIIDGIRSVIPDIALRTSIMVGFPGETRRDFNALMAFMERARFDHAGVFAYSPEAGTRAARLPGRPRDKTAESRRSALLDLQRQISRSKLDRHVGEVLPVLVEGPHPETDLLLSGRLATQAPEVDGSVIITGGEATQGELAEVRITASHDYDLEGFLETRQ